MVCPSWSFRHEQELEAFRVTHLQLTSEKAAEWLGEVYGLSKSYDEVLED